MGKKGNMFLDSAKELKKTSALAVCAMLAALALILNSVASINIGPYVKIGFSGIPNQLMDYLFGPVSGCLFAGVLDLVKFFMKPDGPFFFGFTFNAMLAAFTQEPDHVADRFRYFLYDHPSARADRNFPYIPSWPGSGYGLIAKAFLN